MPPSMSTRADREQNELMPTFISHPLPRNEAGIKMVVIPISKRMICLEKIAYFHSSLKE